MNNIEIFENLKNILVNEIKVSSSITMSTALIGSQIIDSLDFMNYITIIEETYNITISDDDISNFKLGVIENMVLYIKEKHIE